MVVCLVVNCKEESRFKNAHGHFCVAHRGIAFATSFVIKMMHLLPSGNCLKDLDIVLLNEINTRLDKIEKCSSVYFAALEEKKILKHHLKELKLRREEVFKYFKFKIKCTA